MGAVTANFFWHGRPLRLFERACISSFVRGGLAAKLYSFDPNISVPDGVQVMDARQFAREDEVYAYTQEGISGSIAAFADIFRYRLFESEPGWWFDTDVFCLSSAEQFRALEKTSKGILVGEQAPNDLNAAVLYISDCAVAQQLVERASAKGFEFGWGAMGPDLITDYVSDFPGKSTVVPASKFYPIHYLETSKFFDPAAKAECDDRAKDAVCVHLWNEILRRWNIPQDVLPCDGSYLHEKFSALELRVDRAASLPFGTFQTLSEISPAGLKALKFVNYLRHLRDQIKAWF